MNKKIIIVLTLLLSVTSACATVQYMTVEQQSGVKYSFLLKEYPVIIYENGSLVVNGSASTSYAISGVKNYHFTEKDETGVENISSDMLRIVYIDDATIEVQNASTNVKVLLVNANGSVLSASPVDATGMARVILPNQKGVYILTVNSKSFKIIRK